MDQGDASADQNSHIRAFVHVWWMTAFRSRRTQMTTIRATMAQALVRYLAAQKVERDGEVQPFFAGVFGIFGHGNVTGLGQALEEHRDLLRYYRPQNEQAMVHTAAAYARMKNRLQTFACTSSVGP